MGSVRKSDIGVGRKMGNDELMVLWPRHPVPCALAIVGTSAQGALLNELERAQAKAIYTVSAIISDHVPLGGSLQDSISHPPQNTIGLPNGPLTIYLHHGRHNAVYFDLVPDDRRRLQTIQVEVESTSPHAAIQAARTEINQLLDSLQRRVWLPLVIARLELFDANKQLLGYQLQLPFSAGIEIGPLGGIHQYPVFAEREALVREAVCSSSPYYRLLCAFRLYDGFAQLRTWLKQTGEKLGVDAPLPKEMKVDPDLLTGLGFKPEFCEGIRTVHDLFGKLTKMRNGVAHFLLNNENQPLHLSDGNTYLECSAAAAATVHYSFETLRMFEAYFSEHLGGKLARGSILPMINQRAQFRIKA